MDKLEKWAEKDSYRHLRHELRPRGFYEHHIFPANNVRFFKGYPLHTDNNDVSSRKPVAQETANTATIYFVSFVCFRTPFPLMTMRGLLHRPFRYLAS